MGDEEERLAVTQLADEFKKIFTISSKPSHDSWWDKYNRIFMTKLLLVCTTVIGVNQYKDSISCIIPESLDVCTKSDSPTTCSFIHAACWIQGIYVYAQLLNHADDSAYYGMPRDIDHDGMINGTTELCVVERKLGARSNPNCIPMEKTFYLQYQWFAFLVGTLAIFYYVPYIMFKKVNKHLYEFGEVVTTEGVTSDDIVECYFQHRYDVGDEERRRRRKAASEERIRCLLNVVVKMLYSVANLISFIAMDNVLYGRFFWYGIEWVRWSQLDNTQQYDYLGSRAHPKPGNSLLPTFGFCEFFESARDVKATRANKFKLMCELSQHILYQYCLLLLWFAIVVGGVMSLFGAVHLIWQSCDGKQREGWRREGLGRVTSRQAEFLMFLERTDSDLYAEVVQKMKDIKAV